MDKLKIRFVIREFIESMFQEEQVDAVNIGEANIDEERITNTAAKEKVKDRKNFVASHTYGEDLGDLGQMYVAYSYGEQHPLYVWHDDKWYHNNDDYLLPDGEANIWTAKHLKDLKPSNETHGLSNMALQTIIRKFKKKHGLGDNNHTDLEPGEK